MAEDSDMSAFATESDVLEHCTYTHSDVLEWLFRCLFLNM